MRALLRAYSTEKKILILSKNNSVARNEEIKQNVMVTFQGATDGKLLERWHRQCGDTMHM